jgi:hypothetical protein
MAFSKKARAAQRLARQGERATGYVENLREGERAFLAGHGQEANPYQPGTEEAEIWSEGWWDARDVFGKPAAKAVAAEPELPTIQDMERAARESHIAQHAIRGERYATDAEMEMHLADPLAFYELVRDDVISATGCDLDGRTVVRADSRTVDDAMDRKAKRHAYNAAWLAERPRCPACDAGAPRTRDGRHHPGFAGKRFYVCRMRAAPLAAEQVAADPKPARVAVPAAAPSVGRMALLTTRCIMAARPSPAEGLRLVSLAALAWLSLRESSPASRMWLGQMRGAFRRAMAVRAAAEAAIQPTPWLDLLGSHAITSAAVMGVVACIVTYLTVR